MSCCGSALMAPGSHRAWGALQLPGGCMEPGCSRAGTPKAAMGAPEPSQVPLGWVLGGMAESVPMSLVWGLPVPQFPRVGGEQ